MARIARVVAPGLPHHITQRGNRRQTTFFSDNDYRYYLDLLGEWCIYHQVLVWSYCLMPNHVHLIVVCGSTEMIPNAVNTNTALYATALDAGLNSLNANNLWQQLSEGDQKSIKDAVGLVPLVKPDIASDESLATYLNGKSLNTARTEIDAIPGRVQQAIERAAKIFEPKVQTLSVERATLRNKADIDAWLDRQKARLIEAVKQGPVLIN